MSEDQWIKVTKDDKKRVMRRRQNARPHKQHVALELTSMDELLQTFTLCRERFQQTTLFSYLQENIWNSSINQNRLQIICYGVGNFSHTSKQHFSASLWQLSAALSLRESLESKISMSFYDPCSTALEADFLSQCLQVSVPTINDQGRCNVQGVTTIFFMPHCPVSLYENVVWENWKDLGSHVIVIGNSLMDIADGLRKPKPPVPSLQASLALMKQTKLELGTKAEVDNLPGNYEGAFNDTYITTFEENKEQQVGGGGNKAKIKRPPKSSDFIEPELLL